MLKIIEKENCYGKYVNYETKLEIFNLVLSANELVFLKVGNKILYDAYENDMDEMKNSFNQKYRYNQMYLNISANTTGYSFKKEYFFKGQEKSLLLSETINNTERETTENEYILSREELEQLLDKKNYSSIFLFHRNGPCIYAYDKHNDLEFGNLVPSNYDIIKRDLSARRAKFNITKSLRPSLATHEEYEKSHTERDIDEITNLPIYASSLMGKYSHFLLTTFNNQIQLLWFKLELIEKDKFRVSTCPINVIECDLEKTLTDANKHIVDFAPDNSLYDIDEGTKRVKIKN